MHSFRLAHAGVVLETHDSSLFIDPGSFTTPDELTRALDATAPPSGIVITHEHADHWTAEHIRAIRDRAPGARIFTTAATAQALSQANIDTDVTVVHAGEIHELRPFTLEFYGQHHALLHTSIPLIDNVGVIVNGSFAYGGDALTPPPHQVDVLGIPIGSPWSNIAQVMDFTLEATPTRAYLTHDAMLSPAGLGMYGQRVKWCLDQHGGSIIELPRIDDDPTARLDLGE